jgi:hypothetical protein
LKKHEVECGYRRVPCPDGLCKAKVVLTELLTHIREEHKDAVWEKKTGLVRQDDSYCFNSCLKSNEFVRATLGRIWFINSKDHFDSKENNWVLNLWRYDGHTFIARICKLSNLWYTWVYVVGGPKAAARFMSEIATENAEGKADCALLYLGRVHPIDEGQRDICRSGDCMVMTNKVISRHVTAAQVEDGDYDRLLGINYTIVHTERGKD